MGSQCDVASFVLRFRQHQRHDETTGKPRVEYRGHIRHVQDDDEMCFTDLSHAVDFIRARLAASQPAISSPEHGASGLADAQARMDHIPSGSGIVGLEDSLPA